MVTTAVLARSLPVSRRGLTTSARLMELQRTPLYDFNVARGAKMVPFAGFSMPLSYGDVGQIAAHHHVRASCGLFDVSHMVQHTFSGAGAEAFLLSLTPSALHALAPFTSTLSVLLNDAGGIVDDTIITKHSGGSFYVVTNAGRADVDRALFRQKIEEWNTSGKKEVTWETLDGHGLVALQGPRAAKVLQKLVKEDLAEIKFGQSTWADVAGVPCHVARGGYTGEDGFEISIPPAHAVAVAEALAADDAVLPIGLGARDSLRLEAGMCLYGHDLDESVSPVEAGLSWVIGKDRHAGAEPALVFPGHARILRELADGPARRRVGLIVQGAPAREGSKVLSTAGEEIGVVTSGIPSPTLGKNIAMGYVKSGSHKRGTPVVVDVRRKLRDAVVAPMPFVPTKYYK
ncbi:Aminomethyltransferase, mitochondrial [Cryptotrichosporon argae]